MEKPQFPLLIAVLSGFLYLAACSSTPSSSPSAEKNIYDSVTKDDVSYAGEEKSEEEKHQEFINNLVEEVRTLFLRRNYEEAEIQAERLIRVGTNNPEGYYWLTRVKLAVGDYQQAYNAASQGLNYATKTGLKRELEHLQRQAQMGAN